jgi:hypothetical protein
MENGLFKLAMQVVLRETLELSNEVLKWKHPP